MIFTVQGQPHITSLILPRGSSAGYGIVNKVAAAGWRCRICSSKAKPAKSHRLASHRGEHDKCVCRRNEREVKQMM
jgi:hypothetical protein